MEKKDIIELKDEELNEVNGGQVLNTAAYSGENVRYATLTSDRANYAAISGNAPGSEKVNRFRQTFVVGKEDKSHRTIRDYLAGVPGMFIVLRVLFPGEHK